MNEIPSTQAGGRARTAEEQGWLVAFGLAPDAHTCQLRDSLGEASVDDVLVVRAGLSALQETYPGLYLRATVLAPENEAPGDALRRLNLPEHGCLTNANGSWIEARRLIVMALVDIVDDMPVIATNPFQS